jgi:hypothetical protein
LSRSKWSEFAMTIPSRGGSSSGIVKFTLSKRGSMTDQTKATGTLKLIREASAAKLKPRGVP